MTATLIAIAVLCAAAAAASATTYNVNVTSDTDQSGTGACMSGGSPCSLREAINAVNAGPGGDTVVVPAGTYTVNATFGALSINQSVTVSGAGASSTILDGGGATEILRINSGTVSLSGFTLSHGLASNRGGAIDDGGNLTVSSDTFSQNTSGGAGGAIENRHVLTVINSTFSGNSSAAYGGAINNEGVVGAQQLTVSQSTFSGNQTGPQGGGAISVSINSGVPAVNINQTLFTGNSATNGGGGGAFLVSNPSGPLPPVVITDSTFTGNQAADTGGAINDGRSASALTNDTIVGNTAANEGGSIEVSGGAPAPTLKNTILAGGSAPSGANCNTAVNSGGHNLEDANTCGLTGPGDQTNTNPKLGSLANNGGPTQTMALLAGSPAINTGDNAGCPATDQRGVIRPQQGVCDIGAYEVAPPSASTGAATGVSPTGATISAAVANPDAVAGTVTFEYGTSTGYGATVVESAASLTGPGLYAATLSLLHPNTTYHYTVIVTNPDGTSVGGDRTFTTAAAPNKFSVNGRHVSKNGTITIKLGAPWAGRFNGKATFRVKHGKHRKTFTYGSGKKTAGGAGTVTLTIKLTAKARKQLLKLGKATVPVLITFTPSGGKPSHRTIKLVIKVNRKHRFS